MRTLPFILAALFNSIATADPITMDRFSVDLISWPGTNPQAGTDGALAVVLDIEDHWHLQAGAGTPEAKPDAIPTELEITAPEGWTIGQPVWPAAADFSCDSPHFQVRDDSKAGAASLFVFFRNSFNIFNFGLLRYLQVS